MEINETKTNKYEEIIGNVKALHEELKPLYNAVDKLEKELDNMNVGEMASEYPLSDIIIRTTKTARRHNVEKKVDFGEYTTGNPRKLEVGTNHQGLGVVSSYGTQLIPLVTERYYQGDEEKLRAILSDKEALLEITNIIKKSNQKIFLRAINVLKKYNLPKAFKDFKKEQQKEIVYNIDDKHKLKINCYSYSKEFTLIYDDERVIGNFEIDNNSDDKASILKEETHDILKGISENKIRNSDLEGIKLGYFLIDHKDKIIEFLSTRSAEIKQSLTKFKDEKKELNKILSPLLALDNI